MVEGHAAVFCQQHGVLDAYTAKAFDVNPRFKGENHAFLQQGLVLGQLRQTQAVIQPVAQTVMKYAP